MTEFSIYNLKSLFYNLREQGTLTNYTTLVVFLTWVSKELLDTAYVEIIKVSLVFCVYYWDEIA